MYNCIFSAYCTKLSCDKSCPILAETSYLLERNKIDMTSNVFQADPKSLERCRSALRMADSSVKCWSFNNNIEPAADLITYCAICQNWKGSRLHCTVYHLNLSRYLELIRNSWSLSNEPEELEYMRIWIRTSKILVVSGFQYIRFKDFESQTLLNIIQDRGSGQRSTLIVSPTLDSLVGDIGPNSFFFRMKELLKEVSIVC